MFMVALLLIAQTWKQPKCPSAGEQTVPYSQHGVLLSHDEEL